MGLLDFFRRRGGPSEQSEDDATEAAEAPPGLAAEGPPVGASDPGSLTGEDVAPDR